MSLKKIVLVGGSGFGRETLDVVEAMRVTDPEIHLLGVIDDGLSDLNRARLESRGVSHLGGLDKWSANPNGATHFVVGIGAPHIRRILTAKLEECGLRPFTCIHPTAVLGSRTQIGAGSVICAGVVVSTNVQIGPSVHINPHATIGHDSCLEEFVSINPAAVISGEVHVKSGVLVGANALVLQNLTVGEGSVIGASALVTKNVPRDVVVKGVPGKWESS